jgi:beta-glucanase (GH16 family)
MRHACALFVVVTASTVIAAPPAGIAWVETFRDDFDGTTLDTTKWHPHDHFCGTRNNELQAYVPENAIIENGLCRLIAEQRQVDYGYCGQPANVKQYAAGIIISEDTFDQQYGYWEIRCQSPAGQGLWPAFWMLPYDKWPPEIDVLEILGHEPDRVHMTNHYNNELGAHQATGTSYKGPDFSAGFHEFGVLWRPDSLVWYVDGVVRHRSGSGVPQEPFYILANLAVGGNWPGAPDASTQFPCSFDIDHIAVWQFPDSVLNRFNKRPVVTIEQPANGSIVRAGQALTIRAAASDSDGVVSRVVFLVDGDTLSTATGAPWETPWNESTPGTYAITCYAVDDSGWVSEPARATVRLIPADGDLILNGEFDDSLTYWSGGGSSGAAGTPTVVTGAGLSGTHAARITLTSAGTADWHYQFSQNVPLIAGDTLEIWFDAKASVSKPVRIMFQQNQSPWSEYWSTALTVGTSPTTFGPYRFVSTVTDPNARLKFLVGADTADIWLDNVRVLWKPSTSAVPHQSVRPRRTTRHRRAARFDVRGRAIPVTAEAADGAVVEEQGSRGRVRVRIDGIR